MFGAYFYLIRQRPDGPHPVVWKFGLRLRIGCQTQHLGFLHHYLPAGAMGFRLIFQLADQIACDGMRPAVQANVLNDRAQACLVRVQEVVANTPFQLPR